MAQKDFQAMTGMGNVEVFSDEVFGFHAQQAVEKSLKAWLVLNGKEYPLTHSLRVLMAELTQTGEDMEPLMDLVELNAYAVQYRYDSIEPDEVPLDRAEMVKKVGALVNKVLEKLDRL
jgi:HEPN domain-containing protein